MTKKLTPIQIVEQGDPSGCGIACLAMILCRSYESVKDDLEKSLGWRHGKETFYTKPPTLVDYLVRCGISAKKCKFGGWNNLDGTALLGVNSNAGKYHWIVVIRNKTSFLIIDPETAEVHQGSEWANFADGGYVTNARSPYICLPEHSVTHIAIAAV